MNLKKHFLFMTLAFAAGVCAQQTEPVRNVPIFTPDSSAAPAEVAPEAVPTEVPATEAAQAPAIEPAATESEAGVNADSSAAPAETAATEVATETVPADSATATQAAPAFIPEPATAVAPDTTKPPMTPNIIPKNAVEPTTTATTPEAAQTQAPDTAKVTAETPAVAAAPIAPADTNTAKPKEPQKVEKHPLDMLHGSAYNMVSNEAAAATVGGNLAIPHKMRGLKFGYFEPVDNIGTVAFGDERTYFASFDNSHDLGLITAGIAFNKFAFSIDAAVGKHWTYADYADHETTSKSTDGGTLVGGTASIKAQNLDVALTGMFVRPTDIGYSEEPGINVENRIWDVFASLTFSKSNDPKFAWSANLNFIRHSNEKEVNQLTTKMVDGQLYAIKHKSVGTDTTARTEVLPQFNIGSTILSSSKARIFLGLNTMAAFIFFDRLEGYRSKHNVYGLFTTPNILGEVALGNHIVAFASAEYTWDVIDFSDFKYQETKIQKVDIESSTTDVNLGFRFQYECAALEMAFTKQFIKNPFGSFSDHDDIAMSIGAFIMF
ncbi:MAG: hypothetical protein MJY82_10235 [Fibrobacter sp.]|nr:hypothetical protein [Fibrobacter sp.]